MPERLAQLDFLGGSKSTETGWTSPYLSAHRVLRTRRTPWIMRAGWRVLERLLDAATDEELERPTRGYSYGDEPGPPHMARRSSRRP